MYQRMTHESQSNPLLRGYSFNSYLVAGLTPILADGPLDFFIDRPDGMKGYIINLTIKGQGRVSDGETDFSVIRGFTAFSAKIQTFLRSLAAQ